MVAASAGAPPSSCLRTSLRSEFLRTSNVCTTRCKLSTSGGSIICWSDRRRKLRNASSNLWAAALTIASTPAAAPEQPSPPETPPATDAPPSPWSASSASRAIAFVSLIAALPAELLSSLPATLAPFALERLARREAKRRAVDKSPGSAESRASSLSRETRSVAASMAAARESSRAPGASPSPATAAAPMEDRSRPSEASAPCRCVPRRPRFALGRGLVLRGGVRVWRCGRLLKAMLRTRFRCPSRSVANSSRSSL
mmetsp:Transcript_123505/g.349097  ORF Transcript_123505/g.349097 Transcript_123505/m.349097 type:complete len:256 (-) Transcript_123505:741-1508(-)